MICSDGICRFNGLVNNENLLHGVTTKKLGPVKMIFQQFNEEKLSSIVGKLNIPLSDCIFMDQIHGNNITVVERQHKRIIPKTDSLITDKKRIYMAAATADCLPIIIYEKEKNILAVIHAGYKGLLLNIIGATIEKIIKMGGCKDNIFVGLGPCIDSCCYNISEDRAKIFIKHFPEAKRIIEYKNSKIYLSLKSIAIQQVKRYLISEKNIEVSEYCTYHDSDLFFSFRKDGVKSGLFLTIAGMI